MSNFKITKHKDYYEDYYIISENNIEKYYIANFSDITIFSKYKDGMLDNCIKLQTKIDIDPSNIDQSLENISKILLLI